MSEDTPAPFANFVPSEAPAASEKPAKGSTRKGKNKGAKPKKAAAPAQAPAAEPTQPAKLPRKRRAKKIADKPRTIKVDPLQIFAACVGLGLDDVAVVGKIMQVMQKLPKKARTKVIAALGKVFA